MRAADDLLHGHLDEAAAHLAVAESYVETAPPGRLSRSARPNTCNRSIYTKLQASDRSSAVQRARAAATVGRAHAVARVVTTSW
ncbi:hypothetical protein [Kribbella sp. VKM Ac-2568]|uniref:hypothetical protein n=1 Tax=Kribbella sp. VKM Ac-2568 TaxID=2512219 RepID=UPI001043E3E1|nr:hypothetical protein [Kribbella sp. VKM Ac-2568]